MPIYEYRCPTCGARAERIQPVKAPTAPPCPRAPEHGAMTRQISQTTFRLGGGGWAADGYADKR